MKFSATAAKWNVDLKAHVAVVNGAGWYPVACPAHDRVETFDDGGNLVSVTKGSGHKPSCPACKEIAALTLQHIRQVENS